MVTEAGKELLRNTINTAKFHNKILEENEMWKQWEIERGLTMMVSDDVILNRNKKHHQCSRHRKRSISSRNRTKEKMEKASRNVSAPGSSKDVIDRWDHNGFRELYPDDADSASCSSSSAKDSNKKWDHSGYLELYPEEAHKEKPVTSSNKDHPKKQKKRKDHHSNASTSDNEIWEEFKSFKRSRTAEKSKKSYDSHVKEWKKQAKSNRYSSSDDD